MRIFISHSSADYLLAETFVGLLRYALVGLRASDIRCTSVDGHRLPAGIDFDEQLRQEVFEAEALVALLSPASLQSTFVLFELGARWAANRPLLAIRVGGLKPESLKGPLSQRHTANGSSEAEMADLLNTLSKILGTEVEGYPVYAARIKEFVQRSLSATPKQSTALEHASYSDGEVSQHSNAARIKSPAELAEVPQRLPVSGRTSKLHADFRPWLVVEAPNGQLYPQAPLSREVGEWVKEVRVGRADAGPDKGYEYVVLLVAAGVDANYSFERYLRGESESKDGLGSIRPSDMIILDSRRVIRGD